MSRNRPAEAGTQCSVEERRLAVDRAFPDLPVAVRAWLAEQARLTEFLSECGDQLVAGTISPTDLTSLASRWSEALPVRRGATVYWLQHFMQPELDLGLPKNPLRWRRRSKMPKRRSKR
jgi:hypothetical protein